MNKHSTIPKIYIDETSYCYNVDQDGQCMAYNHMDCKYDCPARISNLGSLRRLYQSLMYRAQGPDLYFYREQIEQITKEIQEDQTSDILACLWADQHRGTKGGSSESDSNGRAGLKQKLKDNRPVECKWNSAQREEIKTLTEEWEAEHGKLPKLPRSMLSRGTKDKKDQK